MGTVADKIQYTYNAIADIKLALQSRGVDIIGVPLNKYGDLIRNLIGDKTRLFFDTVLFSVNDNYLADSYNNYEGIPITKYTIATIFSESDYTPIIEGDEIVDITTMVNTETEEV